MTDYIALLLAQQMEAEEREDRSWREDRDRIVFPLRRETEGERMVRLEADNMEEHQTGGSRIEERAEQTSGDSERIKPERLSVLQRQKAEEPGTIWGRNEGAAALHLQAGEPGWGQEPVGRAGTALLAGKERSGNAPTSGEADTRAAKEARDRGAENARQAELSLEEEQRVWQSGWEGTLRRTLAERDLEGEERVFRQRQVEESRAERSAGGRAVWADQALRASLIALPGPRRETRVVTLERPDRGRDAGGLDPEGLDRLLRRDARRFDGGFQLL